ncbi:hypothetical protein M2189_003555 [Bradyrhizobium japonicum]|uniref:hypothetical protein n=1 Tax=Bradyrhizobium japonicum TaxID=375 RepID=UPI0021676F11|nr:hypothetical protein [Bradyrhizobium japonicum]MCS3497486.1 hypothetical protein [Bradyrhizobium japonicum]MCS3960352.1 hypothetical protein [Bradyrhizobium japonicum]MCS4002106.1 hypothetical protein [Bradyrhizobium japonicum]
MVTTMKMRPVTFMLTEGLTLHDYVASTLYGGDEVKALNDGDAEELANWLISRVVKTLEQDPRLAQLQWTGWHKLLEGVCDEATSKLMELMDGKIDVHETVKALDKCLPREASRARGLEVQP